MNLNNIYRQLFGKDHLQDTTVTDLSEYGRVGGVDTGQGFKHVQFAPMNTRMYSNISLSYVGFANPGTGISQPNWRIMRISNDGTFTDFPNGSTEFEFIWTAKELLSYA